MNQEHPEYHNDCNHLTDIIQKNYGDNVSWHGNFDKNLRLKMLTFIDKMKLNDIVFLGKAYELENSNIIEDRSRFGLYLRDENYDIHAFMMLFLKQK